MKVSDIEKMTSLERVELAGRFWDSLDPAEYPVPEEHLWILRQCVADYGQLDARNEVKLAAERVLDKLERRSAGVPGTKRMNPLEIDDQTTEEAIRLMNVVLDSVRSACELYDPTPEQLAELRRALAAHRAGDRGMPLEETIEEVFGKL